MDRSLKLVERAYVGAGRGELIVASQLKNFFMEWLDNVDIRIVVFGEQLGMLQATYEKALVESKLRYRVGLNLGREHMHEPMKVCHTRRRTNV